MSYRKFLELSEAGIAYRMRLIANQVFCASRCIDVGLKGWLWADRAKIGVETDES